MFFIQSLESFGLKIANIIFIILFMYWIMKQVYYIGYNELAYEINKPSAWLNLLFWYILISICVLLIISLVNSLLPEAHMAKYAFQDEIAAALISILMTWASCLKGRRTRRNYSECDNLCKTSLAEKLFIFMQNQNKIKGSSW